MRKIKTVISVVLCAAMLAALALPLTGCGEQKKYEAAAALYDSGQWEEARAAFEELAGLEYEDAADRVTACDYAIAKETMEAEEYEKAEELFEELGDYGDSADLVTECRYKRALGLYEAEDYEAADKIFSGMKDYADCRRLSMICRMRYDVEGCLDGLESTVNAGFRMEDLPFRLERGEEQGKQDGHRYYYVLPDGVQPGDPSVPDVFVLFANTDGKGTEYSRGQVNTFLVFGYLDRYNEKDFEDMFTMFLSAAIVLKGAAAEDDDYDAVAEAFTEEYNRLFSDVSADGPAEDEGEYEGYSTYSCMNVSDGSVRCIYSMYIPELADEQ